MTKQESDFLDAMKQKSRFERTDSEVQRLREISRRRFPGGINPPQPGHYPPKMNYDFQEDWRRREEALRRINRRNKRKLGHQY